MNTHRTATIFLLIGIVLFSFSCKKEDPEEVPEEQEMEEMVIPTIESPNILFIIADDLGKDAINGYSEGVIKPTTPHIDAIRNEGVKFNNMWVYPTCTPTRASMITGKYGYSTGVKWAGNELGTSETTLQKYITDKTSSKYATAIVGKWHLSGSSANVNPETFGIDYYAGLIRGAVSDYYQWQLTEDGVGTQNTDYTTTVFTDLAIDWVSEQTKPWFLWLAYNAPHTPFHIPPSEMHNQGSLPAYSTGADPTPYYMAAIEAMDFQIGRFLDDLSSEEKENTVIIFIGDNGTPTDAAQTPYSASTVKGTLFQGGINVPMFISGKDVTRTGEDNNLISGTDLFATIASIAGVSVSDINDSKSFKALLSSATDIRKFQYSEMDDTKDDAWAINNGNYKLIVDSKGNEEMYDLINDPYEQINLLNGTLTSDQTDAKSELEAELLNIRK